jgi:hypothetical protein
MRTKVTLILLFLNVALFFFIFRFEREWRTEQAMLEARKRVLGPEAANIRSLEIAGAPGTEPIRLERRGEGWTLTSPLEWPANHHAVQVILNELKLLEHEASFTVADLERNGQTLAEFGLETPRLTVTFRAGSTDTSAEPGPPRTLGIGDETPVGNRLYVLSPDGARVHVVGRTLLDSLRLPPEQLRAPTFFTIPFFEVRSLSVQTATPANLRTRVRRGEGDRWMLENPIVARANRTAVQLAINNLNALETRAFLGTERSNPDLAEKAGLGSRALRITLEGTNRRETLLLGADIGRLPVAEDPNAEPDFEMYARLENELGDRSPVFSVAVPAILLKTLRNAQVELRDRRILDLEHRTITAVTLSAPGLPDLTLQRLDAGPAGTSWQMIRRDQTNGAATIPADREVVERLLVHLQALSAREPDGFVTDAPGAPDLESWGLATPRQADRVITVNLTGGPEGAPESLTLLLGAARDGLVYAKLAAQDSVFLVDPLILRATPVVPRVYRERLLRDLPAGARLTAIVLRKTADGSTIYERTLEGSETWEQALANEPEARRTALLSLRDQLRTLRAQAFVLDTFPPTIPVNGEETVWSYRLDATLSLVGGDGGQATTSSLYFSERLGGSTQLVGSPDLQGGVVFEATQTLLDALWTLIYGPRDPGPPATLPPPPAPVP